MRVVVFNADGKILSFGGVDQLSAGEWLVRPQDLGLPVADPVRKVVRLNPGLYEAVEITADPSGSGGVESTLLEPQVIHGDAP